MIGGNNGNCLWDDTAGTNEMIIFGKLGEKAEEKPSVNMWYKYIIHVWVTIKMLP